MEGPSKMEIINSILEFEIFRFKEHYLTVFEILSAIAIFFIAKLAVWINQKTLLSNSKNDEGNLYAINQLIKYFVWIIAIAFILEALGFEYSIILAGSAALLVGIGLGLQQTFNDILSGIILLFEKSVKVGDVLEIDGDVVIIKQIGFRASKGLNRRRIIMIIPNSIITANKVINWSHQTKNTLFSIDVGVAYGSDVDLVMKVLKESALEHPDINKGDLIEGRLLEFGPSSLHFQLLFYSNEIFSIEKVRSDIRMIISRKFVEHNIVIPFPQLDLHLRSQIDDISNSA